ncbi:tetratricopeptide repeat-containing glycosyltransferase [Pseudazoarcus pumilus]|uniref:Glycosyltransferase 2-like domain-containing protein n=1 Tax=Pseudazoarcus pumilus TaxID=2067960 RepID=A0A2I6S7T5_9RHOO|nr:glycosyltransferase [Pseudazoarcus pumilus]AUN95329.1 hypothetical protein C0099_10550 [Pseudazoarcus pumilus]
MTTICLCAIFRNEQRNVRRCLDALLSVIDCVSICDTGSDDDTPAAIEGWGRDRGVPVRVHHAPFRDFGHNRSLSFELARAAYPEADYMLLLDADMVLRIEPGWDKSSLSADQYLLRQRQGRLEYWNTRLVRAALPWRCIGVTHEYWTCDQVHARERLGSLWIDDRGDGGCKADKFERDRRLLAAGIEDADTPPALRTRYLFYLGQTLRDMGQLDAALDAYTRRVAAGGWGEEVWYAMHEAAKLRERLGHDASAVVDAHLAAYRFRPVRAETLVSLAAWYRQREDWPMARLHAEAARGTPRPDDILFVDDDVYAWKADDEAAIAAYWTGDPVRSFGLCQRLLDGDRLPEAQRTRVEANRDHSAPAMLRDTSRHPHAQIAAITDSLADGRRDGDVTLTITTCKRLALFEKTVDSFLNCCTDVDAVARFVCIDDNSDAADRERMRSRYPFFEFVFKDEHEKGHALSMNRLRAMIDTPYWLHLEDDWHFFVTTDYIARARQVLDWSPEVAQVLFNRNYAETLEDRALVGGIVRRAGAGGHRYVEHEYLADDDDRLQFFRRHPPGARSNVWWPHFSLRPSLMRTDDVLAIGRFDESGSHFELEFARRYVQAGLKSAFLDTIAAVHTGRLTTQRGAAVANAYDLNGLPQFGTGNPV